MLYVHLQGQSCRKHKPTMTLDISYVNGRLKSPRETSLENTLKL